MLILLLNCVQYEVTNPPRKIIILGGHFILTKGPLAYLVAKSLGWGMVATKRTGFDYLLEQIYGTSFFKKIPSSVPFS
jgi:hypothetical protein